VSVLPSGVTELLGDHLGAQRWYAGTGAPSAESLVVVDSSVLLSVDRGPQLHWVVIEVDGVRYQLLLGQRGAEDATGALRGHEPAVLGFVDGTCIYDATVDPELMLGFFELVVGAPASRVRPVGAEQSNTSLVFDDRVIVKIYRRLLDGRNPDIEVTSALVDAGFSQVAAPAGVWRQGDVDLAFAQQFLSGGTEGWALALTSLRDFSHAAVDDPAETGGDFAGEAGRLGRVTAELHLALARAFEPDPDGLVEEWPAFVDGIARRLQAFVASEAGQRVEVAQRLTDRFRRVRHPGPALRVHGDYHLGQVMRTDGGWYVLDFEGEPARPFEQRVRPSSVMKDITGMLRSLHYVSRFAFGNRDGTRQREDSARIEELARAVAWEDHNRTAFLDGYRSTEGVAGLLADDPEDRDLVMAAFELDKALYELDYEQAYRPDWVDIPRHAIGRVLGRLG
jgi:maltokinase